MNTEKKLQEAFIGFAFIWSFLFWGISIFISLNNDVVLLESANLLSVIISGNLSREQFIISILSTIAGYGPMLSVVFLYFYRPESRKYFNNRFKLKTPYKYILQVLALFLLVTLIPSIAIIISKGFSVTPSWSFLGFVLVFFVYQFITAGTEEIGWRGFLLPSTLKEKTPWKASVSIGLIWAFWHTPIILYVFYSQGLNIVQIIISFAGFIAGTIAMSTVHTYYYLKTKNILFNMFIHTISNTFPMIAGMLFASSYGISVAVQALLWGFVIYITKKNKVLFDTVATPRI